MRSHLEPYSPVKIMYSTSYPAGLLSNLQECRQAVQRRLLVDKATWAVSLHACGCAVLNVDSSEGLE